MFNFNVNIVERALLSGAVSIFCHLHICLFQAGKFDTVPTLINLVAAFTSVGLVGFLIRKDDNNVFFLLLSAFITLFLNLCLQGTVLCDVILLNFLKGAEQYKAKKFEEVLYIVFFNNKFQH